ncbi:hypothetical protein IJ556_05285 [bacterium]|nr:hypothetical protein [bacterium]
MILGGAIANNLYKLDLISERHKALSCNLANMDTPQYTRKDVSFAQYLGGTSGSLETALSIKMGPSPVTVQNLGGKVEPAHELAEMRKMQLMYSEATRRMTSIISEMKQAVSMGSS